MLCDILSQFAFSKFAGEKISQTRTVQGTTALPHSGFVSQIDISVVSDQFAYFANFDKECHFGNSVDTCAIPRF